jgi:hypothetical protein
VGLENLSPMRLGFKSDSVPVFVDQTTRISGDFTLATDSRTAPVPSARPMPDVSDGWQLLQRPMRAVHVVVPRVFGQHP